MSLAAVMRREQRLLLPTYDRYPLCLRRGKGVYVWDDRGRRHLDMLSGLGVNALGHGHPAVRRALLAQSAELVHVSNLYYHRWQGRLAERLTRMAGLERAFFCNSGTEAWEAALKLARAHARAAGRNGNRPAWRVLAVENSFHGRSMGALATTGQPQYRRPFAPLMPGVRFARFDDVADLERKFDGSVCAIGLEVIQGEGGVRPLSKAFLGKARELTRRSGALLLADEVQCGLGRTGAWFAYQKFGVVPDVVTVAKPLAAGLPLGAVLTTDAVARSFHPGMHGTTFGGGPLACAVALAVLDTMEREDLLQNVRRMGGLLRESLEEVASRWGCIREVRGEGLMVGVELDSADLAKRVLAETLKRGVLINRTQETTLRFLPPYIVQEKHILQAVEALEAALASSAGAAHTAAARSTKA